METDYENGVLGVNYNDLLEMRELVGVEGDKEWYQAGVVLAAADLTAKITSVAQQTAAAAQSTGTYGFNAGLQLDIEASKSEETINQTTSLASNITGDNIHIQTGVGQATAAGTNTTIQGSNLIARDALSINTGSLDVLASRDTLEIDSKSEQASISAQMTVYGASVGPSLSGSYSRSKSGENHTTYNNSTLLADNMTLNTTDDMTIRGGNVRADTALNANIGGNLTVESVQNRSRTENNSMGVSGGISLGGSGEVAGANGGINAANGMSVTKETVRSSLTSGGTANITVGGVTQITGATIGTTDDEGNDLGNLNLTTSELRFTDLRDTHVSNQTSGSISTSVSLGGASATALEQGQTLAEDGKGRDMTVNTTNITYSNASEYDASNAMATLGTGNITVGGVALEQDGELTEAGAAEGSALAGLNRDTANTTNELWSIDRQEGDVDLQVDHRMLTADGRRQIKEDFKRSELLGSSVLDVALADSVTLGDSLQHVGDVQKDFDVQKLMATRNDGIAAKVLNNLEVATVEQKEMALGMYAQAYAEVYGININDAKIIAANEIIRGAHYASDTENSTVYINDNAQGNGLNYADTLGHEVTHAQVSQGAIRDRGDHELNDQYANIRGDYSKENYGFSFSNNELGNLNTGVVNNNIGNRTSDVVWDNGQDFLNRAQSDPSNMDYAIYVQDGTNQDKDNLGNQSLSNAARMYNSYRSDNKFYQPGVGTNDGPVGDALGSMFGAGGDDRIDSMYENIVNTYNGVDKDHKPLSSGPDKEIVLVGSSRGATGVSALANTVDERGIPDLSSRETTLFYDNFISPAPAPGVFINSGVPREEVTYTRYLVEPNEGVDIKFMGLFDPVGSYGEPGDNEDGNKNFAITPHTRSVATALSLDGRHDFAAQSTIDPAHPNDSRISEQIFNGAHGDVIGMYPNDTLAKDPLFWMTSQAQAAGVDIASPTGDQLPSGPGNVDRFSHDELVNPDFIWLGRQYLTEDDYEAPRTIFYSQNPSSPYDKNGPDNSNQSDFSDTSSMDEHMNLLNNRVPGSGDPLIYNEDGDGRYDPDAMQNLLDSIMKNKEEADEVN